MSRRGGLLVAALLLALAASLSDTSPQDIQHYTRYTYGAREDDGVRVRGRGRQATGGSQDQVGDEYGAAAAGYSDRGERERVNHRRRVGGRRKGLGSRQRGDQVGVEYVAAPRMRMQSPDF